MLVRFAVTFTALSPVLACTKGASSSPPSDADADATSGPRLTAAPLPPPPDGPCGSDADCKVSLEPCSCACIAHVGEATPIANDQWRTACDGKPPRNCGVASPCTNATATCNTTTKKCALKR